MARDILRGIAVSPGIAIGQAYFRNRRGFVPAMRRFVEDCESEAKRLAGAFERVADELARARSQVPPAFSEQAAILSSHLLICRDPKLSGGARTLIIEKKMCAEWALDESFHAVSKNFAAIKDEYIRERVRDVQVVVERIMEELLGRALPLAAPRQETVLFARDLSPADAIEMSPSRIVSLVTQEGGKTSHTGLLARSQQLPALVGVDGLEGRIPDGATVIVDAIRGFILVEPDAEELAAYAELGRNFSRYHQEIGSKRLLEAKTTDGLLVEVRANIETGAGAKDVAAYGGDGVGLYRTEYGFMNRTTFPTEEELYREYRAAVTALAPREVTFRTLDVGAEKLLAQQKDQAEPNPALGLRGIRYCLQHPALFKRQLRAILRAGAHGPVGIMFPMVSDVGELDQALDLYAEARRELADTDVAQAEHVSVGVMIEVPAAVVLAKTLADRVDFFSIGTNDLVQYLLGIDRLNPRVAPLYQPLHPAVLRALKHTIDAAHQAGIEVCVCGEMANDPYCLPVLLGLSVDALSVPAESIPGIKDLVRHFSYNDCQDLARRLLRVSETDTVNRAVYEFAYARIPEKLAFHLPFAGLGD